MDPFTTTTLLLLFTEELLATDDEDFAELEDATELLLRSSIRTEDDEEELTTDEDDSTELEETTEQELAIELLDCFASLVMTLEEELPGSSIGTEDDESVNTEDDDSMSFPA